MSELALYVVATVVVLAGVAYFFIKQREQEALSQSKNARRNEPKKPKAKKETKEPREIKVKKPRPAKEEVATAPLSKKAEKRREKEEDETKGVLTFLKGKKFSSEQASGTQAVQARVRSAPPPVEKREAAPKPQYDSSEESGSDTEDYEKVKRKIKTTSTKEKPSDVEAEEPKKGKKKPKFFTKQEADEHEASFKAAKEARAKAKADYEARKNMTPEEKKAAAKIRRAAERAAEKAGLADEGEFKNQRERRPRKDRAEGDNEEDNEGDDRRKSRFPPREPDQAPVFASEYEAADMDNILNNLTQYYKSNPDAHRPKQPRAKKVTPEPENSKAESE